MVLVWMWLILMACVVTGVNRRAHGQTFYKWTDDRGIVHFSDTQPANVSGVETRKLPVPQAPKAAPGEEEGEVAETPAADSTPASEGSSGPARVILLSRQVPRTSPSAAHLTGEVKNVGGSDARAVGVTVTAVDATQGTPCLHEEAAVTPSTLRPGETGNFDVDLDSPCLYGDPPIDVVPDWD